MSAEQRSLVHSILLIATFVGLGLLVIDRLIGNPAAIA